MNHLATISALSLTGALVAAGPALAGDGCNSSRSAPVAMTQSSCSGSKAATVSLASYGPQKDIVDTAVSAGSFKTLAAALEAAGLIHALKADGPFTVFAPTDAAFAKLPAGTVKSLLKPENRGTLTAILTYHVVPGRVLAADVVTLSNATTLNGQRIDFATKKSKVMADQARVTATDIECSNGVIHVIDAVMLPSTDTIVTTAVKAGTFKTLAAALTEAELVSALEADGPFTVFAPTDEAFAKLPAGTVESLLKPENRHKLVEILTYHVVPGRIYAKDAVAAERAGTLQGEMVKIRIDGGRVKINDASLVAADIEASNGVIHVIDRVLIPSGS